MWASSHVLLGHLCIFGEMSIQALCPFFNQVVHFFCCSVIGIFNIFWVLTLYQIYDWQMFASILWVAFSLCRFCPLIHRSFKFGVVQFIYLFFYFCCLCFWCCSKTRNTFGWSIVEERWGNKQILFILFGKVRCEDRSQHPLWCWVVQRDLKKKKKKKDKKL